MKNIFLINKILFLIMVILGLIEVVFFGLHYHNLKDQIKVSYDNPQDENDLTKRDIYNAIKKYIKDSSDKNLDGLKDKNNNIKIEKLAKVIYLGDEKYGPYLNKLSKPPKYYIIDINNKQINIYIGKKLLDLNNFYK